MSTQNYSSTSYKYAGRKYSFQAEIFTYDKDGNENGTFLTNDDIVMFTYDNEFNRLYLTGKMIIIDSYGIIDKYLDEQFSFCRIQHYQYDQGKDGAIMTDKLSETYRFIHDFFITNIKIVERKGNTITYELTMVGNTWINCMNQVNFSNYSKEPESVLSIIKSILTDVKLKVYGDSFEKITTPVKINYASQQNDNALTTIRYLLNKLYYYDQKDDSLKFIVYNETEHQYQLFDVKDSTMSNGTSTLFVSLFKNQTEMQTQSELIEMHSTVHMSKEKVFKSIFDHKFIDYLLDDNKFKDKSITSNTLIGYKNTRLTNSTDLYKEKFKKFITDFSFQNNDSYWNNDMDFYDVCSAQVKDDNALVVGTDPEILRKPGSYVALDVDRDDLTIADSEDPRKLNDTKNKYKSFEGMWIISKVRNIIAPQKGLYRQNLILFRNFIKKNAKDEKTIIVK